MFLSLLLALLYFCLHFDGSVNMCHVGCLSIWAFAVVCMGRIPVAVLVAGIDSSCNVVASIDCVVLYRVVMVVVVWS